ncbi:MAG: bifunctional phosphoribosylaminoimidazolecarboxamide formyltransferase/IMP cyclohydrolase [Clostridiales bacterium]|jgi:phosphoribosylaminoimidazolecarboxamide formyltransferase/IMP cyclohydrolase|nr:bifunctional phosphoribosylaminoimidazolecarboxamide formyltransferase/IMP cyclohydrolase [Clostridiales bacterium]
MRALISVYDKTGVAEFAKSLENLGYDIISTGGTFNLLKEAGIKKLLTAEDVTGFPEMLDGRVKTLHPRLHGGILAMRENPGHMGQLEQNGIETVDIVACNLYPFKAAVLKPGVTMEEVIENIDVGGPSMLRAAAKNCRDVTVVCDPSQYAEVISELAGAGTVSRETRLRLAAAAFSHIACYDSMVAGYLNAASGAVFPAELPMGFALQKPLSYGENPHQRAAFYADAGFDGRHGIAAAVQLYGRDLSYNNINDGNAAIKLISEFGEPAAAALKHANPCGVGSGKDAASAFAKALAADPVSIYGGIVAFNRPVDIEAAKLMKPILLDLIIAPAYTDEALGILRVKKNTRVLELASIAERPAPAIEFKRVIGGVTVQERDDCLFPEGASIRDLTVATKRRPTESEYDDLLFAWKIVKHVSSNAIVIAKDGQSVGIGCGQVNRVWATRQAIEHAVEALGEESTNGAALASDAFFPFDDCVEAAAKAGITAIIQPGGSIRDQESIDACDRLGIAMVITGMRHFRH